MKKKERKTQKSSFGLTESKERTEVPPMVALNSFAAKSEQNKPSEGKPGEFLSFPFPGSTKPKIKW